MLGRQSSKLGVFLACGVSEDRVNVCQFEFWEIV
jgi:hypothetical protein